ncbi:MAG: phosphatase PAP2 family protein [Bacteroidota bacterium]
MHNRTSNRNLTIGVTLTVITALYLIIHSCIVGRNEFFLLLNTDLGNTGDIFFRLWTNIGDGVVWVIMAILFYIYRRNQFPLLIAAVLISTLIAQGIKNIAPEPRPSVAITDSSLIHTVSGVELHSSYSFPSGHTTTVFTIFLIACLLLRNKWVVPVGFICALLAAYSRVYLAQHFPLDLGGGMITAVITIIASIGIQKRWERRKS